MLPEGQESEKELRMPGHGDMSRVHKRQENSIIHNCKAELVA